jgi:hypothetical protein
MIGSICVAKDNQAIRLDLDNELEGTLHPLGPPTALTTILDARWFTRADVLAVLNGDGRTHLSRDEVSAIDGKENAAALKEDFEKTNAAAGTDWFRMPPVYVLPPPHYRLRLTMIVQNGDCQRPHRELGPQHLHQRWQALEPPPLFYDKQLKYRHARETF